MSAVLNLGLNSSTTKDWLKASEGMRLTAYNPCLTAEEQEWQCLLASERQRARELGLTNQNVTAAIRERRYGR